MREELQKVRDWAHEKITAGEEPPWAWFQYMKLRETLDQILAATAAVRPPDSLESEEQQGGHLRLVDCNNPPDNAPRRPVGLPVQMPM